MIQLTVRCKTLLCTHRFLKRETQFSQVLTRILLALLHVAEVAHVVDDLLYAADPLAGHLAVGGHQVQVLLALLEDDGEALVFIDRVRVFVEPLRAATEAKGFDVIDGDWRGSKTKIQFNSDSANSVSEEWEKSLLLKKNNCFHFSADKLYLN